MKTNWHGQYIHTWNIIRGEIRRTKMLGISNIKWTWIDTREKKANDMDCQAKSWIIIHFIWFISHDSYQMIHIKWSMLYQYGKYWVHPCWWESWWKFFHQVSKTLGEIERLLVKSKSSWWNVWNLGEILNHLVKLNFTKIKTIQEIWCTLLITHYSYLVYLAYKSYSKKCTIWYGRYVHVVWSIHWKSHIVLLCGLY